MELVASVPQCHQNIGIDRSRHSPRNSRIHFRIAFRPLPIPGLPIPAYFSNTLPSRTAFTRTPWASSSNSSLSPARTPNRRRISRGIVTCPLLVTFACFFISHSPIPYFITILLTFPKSSFGHRTLTASQVALSFSLWPLCLCGRTLSRTLHRLALLPHASQYNSSPAAPCIPPGASLR